MKNFADAIEAVYRWMCIKRDFGGFDISFWDIFILSVIASVMWAIIYKIFDSE